VSPLRSATALHVADTPSERFIGKVADFSVRTLFSARARKTAYGAGALPIIPTDMSAQLIAITGGSGSGKTWLAKKLKRQFGRRAGLLSLDDFYRDLSGLPAKARDKVNFDHPEAIDWVLFLHCLKQIRRGEKTLLPRYDFCTHTRHARPRVWQPRPVVFIDGLWLLSQPKFRRVYAFSVYADCAEEVRLARRLARDQQDRGRSRASVLRQWRSHVKPMHDQHVAPQVKVARMVFNQDSTHESLASLGQIVEKLILANE